ncbi:unnamed protein product [Ectocarpus sp. CCAP 1310/34]|nr:unnamed protein product [Ectocarpus sp. CCAP 1310/34]
MVAVASMSSKREALDVMGHEQALLKSIWPITSRASLFEDMLVPSASATPTPPRMCHPATHDAVDLWNRQ